MSMPCVRYQRLLCQVSVILCNTGYRSNDSLCKIPRSGHSYICSVPDTGMSVDNVDNLSSLMKLYKNVYTKTGNHHSLKRPICVCTMFPWSPGVIQLMVSLQVNLEYPKPPLFLKLTTDWSNSSVLCTSFLLTSLSLMVREWEEKDRRRVSVILTFWSRSGAIPRTPGHLLPATKNADSEAKWFIFHYKMTVIQLCAVRIKWALWILSWRKGLVLQAFKWGPLQQCFPTFFQSWHL